MPTANQQHKSIEFPVCCDMLWHALTIGAWSCKANEGCEKVFTIVKDP